MVALRPHLSLVFLTGVIIGTSAVETFLAAIYEHAVILTGPTPKLVSPEEALNLMNRNLDILEKAIKTAAEQVQQMQGWIVSSIVFVLGSSEFH